MALKETTDPREHGVQLTHDEELEPVTTKTGWTVLAFSGDDGEEYECAARNGEVRWFIVE